MNSNKFKNGDTLIEVLLAMSIFASLNGWSFVLNE